MTPHNDSTQQQRYQPKVGDLVRVLVDRDIYVDKIDTSRFHVVDAVYTRKFIVLKLPDGQKFDGMNIWEVTIDDVEPADPSDTSHTTHFQPLSSELDAIANDLRALLERVERLRARVVKD